MAMVIMHNAPPVPDLAEEMPVPMRSRSPWHASSRLPSRALHDAGGGLPVPGGHCPARDTFLPGSRRGVDGTRTPGFRPRPLWPGPAPGGRVTVNDLEKFLSELEGRSPQPAGRDARGRRGRDAPELGSPVGDRGPLRVPGPHPGSPQRINLTRSPASFSMPSARWRWHLAEDRTPARQADRQTHCSRRPSRWTSVSPSRWTVRPSSSPCCAGRTAYP